MTPTVGSASMADGTTSQNHGQAVVRKPTVVRRPKGDIPAQDRALVRRRWLERILGIATPLGLLLLWEVAARAGMIDQKMFPSPTTIVINGVDLFQSGRLMQETWATLSTVLTGFVMGATAGFTVGGLCGASPLIRAALEPWLSAMYVVPKLAMLPIFLLILGFGNAPKVALVAYTAFFYVWISSMESINSIAPGYLDTGNSLGLSRRSRLRHIYVPAIVPQFFVALRVSMNVAILVTIASEFVIGGVGLGYMIYHARELFDIPTMYTGIVWIALVGVSISYLIRGAGRALAPWQSTAMDRARA